MCTVAFMHRQKMDFSTVTCDYKLGLYYLPLAAKEYWLGNLCNFNMKL